MDSALGPTGVSGTRKNRARFVYRRDSGFVRLSVAHADARTGEDEIGNSEEEKGHTKRWLSIGLASSVGDLGPSPLAQAGATVAGTR